MLSNSGEGRPLRVDADGATDHVLAEQGSMRAAHHFHAVYIEQIGGSSAGTADIYIVNEGGNRRVASGRVVGVADATDVVLRFAHIELGKSEIGRFEGDIRHVHDPAFLDPVAADGSHGNRYLPEGSVHVAVPSR